jgi:hypothetical protein
LDEGTIAGAGLVNLVDQSLDMKLTAVLSKEFSQRVGGQNIGGFMNTALANNQGELVIPLQVSGTFMQPRFAPDLEQVAQMKLQNLVPSLKNPGQLNSGILGNILGGEKNGEARGIGGILGTLGGRKKQQQQQNQPGVGEPAQQPTQPQGQQATEEQKNEDPLGSLLDRALGRKKKPQQPQQQPQQQEQQQQEQKPPQ